MRLKRGEGVVDDIDHLGSRRVRTVGELLANQCRVGLSRTERLVRERMTMYDQSVDSITPQKLINPKALTTVIRDFFARSQLSQFMDQINPLAEVTHKRRLSALGPGGLNRERAGFEVRDVHPSHYGRICPIETPEGPNIGLINSLSTYARVNEFGFIETPYREVKDGRVDRQDRLPHRRPGGGQDHRPGQRRDRRQGPLRRQGHRPHRTASSSRSAPAEVDYMDVSPKQVISIAAGMIPFLEHDDANRALMGSNMQRQGVPLLQAEAPLVGTGIEERVARDSKIVVVAEDAGIVASVDAKRIVVTKDGEMPAADLKHDPKNHVYVYELRKFMRSNAGTCFNQKPIVKRGQKIKAGDDHRRRPVDRPAARWPSAATCSSPSCPGTATTSRTRSSSPRRSSRRTSSPRSTSRNSRSPPATPSSGPRKSPGTSRTSARRPCKNLDHNGVIRVGAEVKPGDILVGKITPKSETELAPEEKLLRAIFGEKAADVKDTSLVVPSGVAGIIMDVKVSSRIDNQQERLSPVRPPPPDQADPGGLQDADGQAARRPDRGPLQHPPRREDPARRRSTARPARSSSRPTARSPRPSCASWPAVSKHVQIDPSPVRIKIMEIIGSYQSKFDELEGDRERKIGSVESGEGSADGAIKQVKVYIATKQKLEVGDKMAGRHGNKGVVAKIVPEEDMPFLPDGTPVEICLNPLGVPSRMNVGQVLETHLGWACKKLGLKVATPVFDGIPEKRVREYLTRGQAAELGQEPALPTAAPARKSTRRSWSATST